METISKQLQLIHDELDVIHKELMAAKRATYSMYYALRYLKEAVEAAHSEEEQSNDSSGKTGG